jgi:hypothetical protein
MGRKPIGEQAMTAAERQQRRRDKMRAFLEKQTKNSNALIRRENRELHQRLEKLDRAGIRFNLHDDAAGEIARQIVNSVSLAKAVDIMSALEQFTRNRLGKR